jgi:hypothetical protein
MNIDNRTDSIHSRVIYDSLHFFAERMESGTTLSDGVLTARVIGEFSAGKTRLLRELFSSMLPEELFPISSLERQTRLQLEITFGEVPNLTLIERAQDYQQAVELRSLPKFLERDELGEFDPLRHRLRLALPDNRLILPAGDGFSDDKSPKRLFLIDTPGWNSGDDTLAEGEAATIMTGYHNLSLVYVTHAGRLDGALNAERLKDFLAAFEEAEFIGQHSLVFIITHCPEQDAARLHQRARRMVMDLWEGLGRQADDLTLNLFCIEFNEMSDVQRQTFRDNFWKALLGPLQQKEQALDPWTSTVRRWPDAWDLRAPIMQTQQLLESMRQLLARACRGDEFIGGMNRHRLLGLDRQAMQKKLHDTWLRQLECNASDLAEVGNGLPRLDDKHPLATWWRDYWLANFERTLEPTRRFFSQMDITIGSVTSETEDLQALLRSVMTTVYKDAGNALDSSFTRLVETAQQLLNETLPERRVATLLNLSLLEARYSDHYANAQLQWSAAA